MQKCVSPPPRRRSRSGRAGARAREGLAQPGAWAYDPSVSAYAPFGVDLKRPIRIVCDVDGVFADTARHTYATYYDEARLAEVDTVGALLAKPPEEVRAKILAAWAADEFWQNVPAVPKAERALQVLTRLTSVSFASPPWPECATWRQARSAWLDALAQRAQASFGAFHAVAVKEHLDGDVLIEDNLANALAWTAGNGNRAMRRHAFLVAHPWNAGPSSEELARHGVTRVADILEAAYAIYVNEATFDARNMTGQLVNLGNTKPGRREMYARIDRSTPYGNPYKVHISCSRRESVAKYAAYFDERVATDAVLRAQVEGLRGRPLGCWCAPLLCHGQVILDYLKRMPPSARASAPPAQVSAPSAQAEDGDAR